MNIWLFALHDPHGSGAAAGEFIRPNWHVVLIHYPIALVSMGVLLELLSCRRPTGLMRAAARWMMLLGALAALPAAAAGVYALRVTIAPGSGEPELAPWNQVVASSSWSDEQWRLMSRHAWLNGAASGVLCAAALGFLASSDRTKPRFYVPLVCLLLVGLGLMSAGAWYGGEAVYGHGTAVLAREQGPPAEADDQSTQLSPAEEHTHNDDRMAQEEAPQSTAENEETGHAHEAGHTKLEAAGGNIRYVGPLQLHVVLAGFAVAILGAALAVSVRTSQTQPGVLAHEQVVAQAGKSTGEGVAGRRAGLWLWGFFAVFGTALAGAWSAMGSFSAEALTANFQMLKDPDHLRLVLHAGLGIAILVLPLAFATLTHTRGQWRFALALCAGLLVVGAAVQVWLGTLMLFDGHDGPLTGFSAAPHEH